MRFTISFMLTVLSFCALIAFPAKAQVDLDKLYDRYWRTKSIDIVKPNKVVPIYYRYENKGGMDYGSSMIIIRRSGVVEGFNAGGWPIRRTFKILSSNQVIFEGDTHPSTIVKLTDKEFLTEKTQPYTTMLGDETYTITSKISNEAFDPCAIYETLRSGNWNDATIWTCQKVPTSADKAQINTNHEVIVPEGYTAHAATLIQKGSLNLEKKAKLSLAQ